LLVCQQETLKYNRTFAKIEYKVDENEKMPHRKTYEALSLKGKKSETLFLPSPIQWQ
tara:strand:+ start:224 stop:394 length:171 start_codon:yes stop_codon:yes gene_type:complete